MAKPRRVSALSSVLKESQEYNKVAQEDEQVTTATAKQETANADIQKSVDTDKQKAVSTDIQQSVNTEVQKAANTEEHKSVNAAMQRPVNTEPSERMHKQTIVISESLALRLKIHAAKKKDTIANIATRAFEKLLAEEE
jgi:hypothetical protein